MENFEFFISGLALAIGGYIVLIACGPLAPEIKTSHKIQVETTSTFVIDTGICKQIVDDAEYIRCVQAATGWQDVLNENGIETEVK